MAFCILLNVCKYVGHLIKSFTFLCIYFVLFIFHMLVHRCTNVILVCTIKLISCNINLSIFFPQVCQLPKRIHEKQWLGTIPSAVRIPLRKQVPPSNPTGQCQWEDNDVCPHCFMRVCVAQANNEAPWLGPGQGASEYNPPIRKQHYKRFWKIVSNLGGWNMEPYIAKKQQLGGNRPDIVYHQREIMPQCVLDLVGSLYPNPSGQPYMGHQWE